MLHETSPLYYQHICMFFHYIVKIEKEKGKRTGEPFFYHIKLLFDFTLKGLFYKMKLLN